MYDDACGLPIFDFYSICFVFRLKSILINGYQLCIIFLTKRFSFFFFLQKQPVGFDEDTQFQNVRYGILKSKLKELLFISFTLQLDL